MKYVICRLLIGTSLTAIVLTCAVGQSTTPNRFTPAVDYHQHLVSPAGVLLLNRSLSPVTVPNDIAALLKSFTDHWNDAPFLRELYTDDAILFVNFRDWRRPWIQGKREAGDYIARVYGRPYAITPIVYSSVGDRVRLSGYFTRGEGASAKHFAFFYFELMKDKDGKWRIAVDNRNFDPRPEYQETISGEQLLKLLDAAGIQQAVVFSDAYWFDSPSYHVDGETSAMEYQRVRAENDWTAQEVSKSGGRLVAFCSFNPLADYALQELARCKSSGAFAGLKLHLQSSGVDLRKPGDVEKVRKVFATADELGLPIAVHAQTVEPYDEAAARTFVEKILPVAPRIPVTIAHLWGGGPFAGKPLEVYVDAVVRKAAGTKNLYFDVAESALVAEGNKEMQAQIASAIRQIGPQRILFGSDAVGSALIPEKATAQFRSDIPLTAEEFAIIASNRMPFVKAEKK